MMRSKFGVLHEGHMVSGGAVIDSYSSNSCLHFLHRYSYVGIFSLQFPLSLLNPRVIRTAAFSNSCIEQAYDIRA